MSNIIYLDNAATTKVDKEVLETYNKVSTTFFANTSSIHSLGYKNNDLLEKARASILSNLNLKDDELIFTSGATESNNLAIKGYALKHKNRGNHIIVWRKIRYAGSMQTPQRVFSGISNGGL